MIGKTLDLGASLPRHVISSPEQSLSLCLELPLFCFHLIFLSATSLGFLARKATPSLKQYNRMVYAYLHKNVTPF
jgi:hypothetical protein